MLCDDPDGWDEVGGGREVQEGGDICTHIVEWLRCTKEINTALQGVYTHTHIYIIVNIYIHRKKNEVA